MKRFISDKQIVEVGDNWKVIKELMEELGTFTRQEELCGYEWEIQG